MKIEPMTLTGKWVRVEPLEERHAADLCVAGNSPEIWTYMSRGRGAFTSVEDTVEWIRSAHKDAKELSQIPFAIINLEKGKAVGSTRYMDISRADWRVEIGWTWLAVSEWRTPINTECKHLLLKHAFESLHCVRVQIKTDLRNVQSQKAIERLGAVKEGVLRKHMMRHDGYVRDTVMYSFIEAEWGEVKRRLEEKMGGH
ncbi:MAG: GNAT family N-acetyltransferase [Chloroflexi bacterium]|nr:GNAT family N-acetyltransferase [Chloroflexota bacterium]